MNRSAGQSLVSGASGTILGSVAAGAGSTIIVGSNGTPGLLTVSQLALTNCTNVMVLGSDPNDQSGATSSIIQDYGSLTLSGTNTFQISPGGSGVLNTTTPYTILQYGGGLTGGLANLRVVSTSPLYTLTLLDPRTTAPYLQVQVAGAPQTLIWKGGAVSGPNVWDQGTTNWLNTVTSHYDKFYNLDPVIFDDSATTNVVNITQAVTSSTTFSNMNLNYTLVGTGPLSGTLDQEGTGTVTLALSSFPLVSGIINNAGTLVLNEAVTGSYTIGIPFSDNGGGLGSIIQAGSNTVQLTGNNLGYYGTLAVTNGILQYNSANALGANPTLYVTNGGTLDFNDISVGIRTLAVSGAGYNGLGALYDSSANTSPHWVIANLTLLGDTVFGGNGRWDFVGSGGTMNGNGFNLTKVGAGAVWLHPDNDTGLGNIDITAGTLGFSYYTGLGDPAKTLTVEPGAVFYIWGVWNTLNKVLVLNNNAMFSSGTAAGSSPNNNFAGPVTFVGTSTFNPSSADLYLWNTLGGTGGFIKAGASALWLNGTNTYSGPTIINGNVGSVIVGVNSSLGSS